MSDPNKTDFHSRAVLPMSYQPHPGLTTYDAKDPNTKFPPIESLRPPKGAPNVLIVLLDDVGFGASTAFGGPCQTPNFEKLASGWIEIQPFPHYRALLARRGKRCSRVATITRLGWAALPRSPLPRPATAPYCPRTRRPWR